MSEKNTVSVLIYGQEYTLSGDMPREYIMKLADKVDEKMREVSNGRNQTLSKTAVLAAMLLTDEYYQEKEKTDQLTGENKSLNSQVANYANLWEEAKCSLSASKSEQDRNAELLKEKIAEQDRTIEVLRAKIAEQDALLEDAKAMPPESAQMITELENRCRDIESSFFDLQMENIRLKNELENYKDRGF